MAEWGEEGGEAWEGEEEDDDSICSWLSEADSLPHNWRGWRAAGPGPSGTKAPAAAAAVVPIHSLSDLAAKSLAANFTLDGVEERLASLGLGFTALHPEAFQMKMIRFCFPRSDHDIRLYSVLASGNSEEFLRGEQLFRAKAVRSLLQIGQLQCPFLPFGGALNEAVAAGFHLSASVRCGSRGGPGGEDFAVAITVDRCHITSCTCTCTSEASWSAIANPPPDTGPSSRRWHPLRCSHTVAVCLHRIHWPDEVEYRAPLSESLNQLARGPNPGDEVEDLRRALRRLQKFAQHLIQQLPRQVSPFPLLSPPDRKGGKGGAPV